MQASDVALRHAKFQWREIMPRTEGGLQHVSAASLLLEAYSNARHRDALDPTYSPDEMVNDETRRHAPVVE